MGTVPAGGAGLRDIAGSVCEEEVMRGNVFIRRVFQKPRGARVC